MPNTRSQQSAKRMPKIWGAQDASTGKGTKHKAQGETGKNRAAAVKTSPNITAAAWKRMKKCSEIPGLA